MIAFMADVSGILKAIENGDQKAASELLPLVYDRLRDLAEAKMAQEKAGHSLQATGLVHEAYLRLVDVKECQAWNSQGHFFAAAAEAMRRILIENARRRHTQRRGGGRRRIDFQNIDLTDPNDCDFLLQLDRSLERLQAEKPLIAEVVRMRFFGGMSIEETARATNLSVRTVNRYWAFAKAWLFNQLSEQHEQSQDHAS
jgi:RNA polymerase sigma factor (TIGR02999 family)